jgi:AraC family transcriptional regulator
LEERLDTAIDWRQLARRLDTGYEHLRKAFVRHTGMSLTRYRMQRRIERAQSLLIQGRSIDAVAMDLGYCDRFFFARQFARVTGLPPGRWLQMRRP